MVLNYGSILLEQPEFLLLIFPLLLILFFLIRYKFFSESLHKKKTYKRLLFLSKSVTFILLLIAISSPLIEQKESIDQMPSVRIIIDNTSSMNLYDKESFYELIRELQSKAILVEKYSINTNDISDIGNELLKRIEPSKNILLISDGYSNSGSALEDIALISANMNSKIYALNLKPEEKDISIRISGPSKVISTVENTYDFIITRTGNKNEVRLKISVDGETVFDQETSEDIIQQEFSFYQGEHTIIAEIDEEDLFPQNNIFYKTIYVVDKPGLLFISKKYSQLAKIYEGLYDVDTVTYIPEDLDKYYAVILNDINAKDLSDNDIQKLEDFLDRENGLLVVGGKNSYDYGDYNKSLLTGLLPVGIGKPKKKKDISNIIIAIDTGGWGREYVNPLTDETTWFRDVQKALIIDLIDDIPDTYKVGVIELFKDMTGSGPSIVSPLGEIYSKREILKDQISKLNRKPVSKLSEGMILAQQLLRLERGGKDLIIFTDGLATNLEGEETIYTYDQMQTLKSAEKLSAEGIKTHVVSVGDKANTNFLEKITLLGSGHYFPADQNSRLNIFFGDPENALDEDELGLFLYDTNHFITQKINIDVEILGLNSVYPKSNSRLLVTTTGGDPILTVWRYGLGRVASLTTDPEIWASRLLSKANSGLIIRTTNWLIEDPERKREIIIDFPEMYANKSKTIVVRSSKIPEDDVLNFYEEQNNIYKSYYFPQTTGFIKLLNRTVSVNYNDEYLNLGINPELSNVLSITGGKFLNNNADEIIQELKSSTSAETIHNIDLSWIFVILAVILYLIEIIARKVHEIRLSRET
ncbi:VWA domain-containing protein [Candidatus Woesearchaeota archaeon]|nr:VWA domain-containing protein [Candidatus Woesearchaeota archaeon]